MSSTDTYARHDVNSGDEITTGPGLASHLFRAAYQHRGIVSAGRAAQFSHLLTSTPFSLPELLHELASTRDRIIGGRIEIDQHGRSMTSYALISVVVNMIAVYILKSFSFLVSDVRRDRDRYGRSYLNRVYNNACFPMKARIDKTLILLEPMMFCDVRWQFVPRGRVEELKDVVQGLIQCLEVADRRVFLLKFQAFIEPWFGHKPRIR